VSQDRELIDAILNRPGVYIGTWAIERLHLYLIGYWSGVRAAAQQGASPDDDFFDAFQDFVQREYQISGIANGKSWALLIRERCTNEHETKREFRRLWDAYKRQRT
jgi:hypothetical protein